jgi:maltose O-acetyltransferase
MKQEAPQTRHSRVGIPGVHAGEHVKNRWLREIRVELGFLTRRALLNSVAGSTFVPRVLRWAIYRWCGAGVATMNVFPGLTLSGPARNLVIGAGTFVNVDCFLELVAPVHIGRDCQIAPPTWHHCTGATRRAASGTAARSGATSPTGASTGSTGSRSTSRPTWTTT